MVSTESSSDCDLDLTNNAERLISPAGRICSLPAVCVTLTVLIAAVYFRIGGYGFLSFDDTVYVTHNPRVIDGFDISDIVWAFSSVHAGNWHPLTWLSHLTDVELFGMDARGHHLVSVIIHTVATLLLFLFLYRSTALLWRSAFVASLFGIHPLHVESVAWIAERKDVLSAMFCFLTLLFYGAYAAQRKHRFYIATLVSFLLGLMSKPMLVTLPLVMLIMDFWPLRRVQDDGRACQGAGSGWPALMIEKIPFVFCSMISSVLTVIAQRSEGAIKGLESFPLSIRAQNALTSYCSYIGKTVWPDGLAVLYPFPQSISAWQVAGSLSVLLIVSGAALRARRRHPYLAAGWLWYLVTLIPVIGIVQVGVQSMADRYSYLPSVGLFIMVAWGVPELFKRTRSRRVFLAVLAVAVVMINSVLSWRQLGYWCDDITLYQRALDVTERNYVIHNNLGSVLANRWDLEAASGEFRKALSINPQYADAHYNLGMTLAMRGEPAGAQRELKEALRLQPGHLKAQQHLELVNDQMMWQKIR